MINYLLLLSRQGKLRLSKWYVTLPNKTKARTIKEATSLVLARRPRTSNVIEFKGRKIVYRRYASLFFICEIAEADNELITLEMVHRYVELLDKYFGNVCELDIIFNFQQAYQILDEIIVGGELVETSSRMAFEAMQKADVIQADEQLQETLKSHGMI